MSSRRPTIRKKLKRVFSRLRGRLEPEIFCLECNQYREILELKSHFHPRVIEYTLECGHKILEKQERKYFRALDHR